MAGYIAEFFGYKSEDGSKRLCLKVEVEFVRLLIRLVLSFLLMVKKEFQMVCALSDKSLKILQI